MDADKVVKTYEPGFIVLSCFVSLIGCITTLELLHQRTSPKGAYNWFLLFAASFTMGGGGIWAMHYIGNRAIMLNHGALSQQVIYSSAFTVLSFFLPIIVLLSAFYLLGTITTKSKLPFIIIPASILTGTAVCCMHYLADYGILNYHCRYHVGNIVGSAVMAVAASLISLSIFFRLQERWTNTWWKRLACAPLLASAVSGMHWTAAVGTRYVAKKHPSHSGGTNRTQTVIICAALSLATCVLLLVVVGIRGWKNKMTHNRAQQLVLACAYFDESGRVMVTPDGALPCQKITNRFIEKTFGEDELSRSHSTFLWIFRASRNWPTVKAFIPAMVGRLDSDLDARKYAPYRSSSTYRDDMVNEASANFSVIFKQLFCVAAEQLANSVHEPLERMGPLFEEPLSTGMRHLTATPPLSTNTTASSSSSSSAAAGVLPDDDRLLDPSKDTTKDTKQFDLEHNNPDHDHFGRGKYLFLNRRLSKSDVDKLAALGYRFAPIDQISDLLAKKMEVCKIVINSFFERMNICCSPEHLMPPGVHLACFVVHPSVAKSFDVLVPEKTQNQLPYSSLHLNRLSGWQSAFLQRFDEWVVKDIIFAIINETGSTEVEKTFLWQLHASFLELIERISDTDAVMNGIFSSRQFQAPCRASEPVALGYGPAPTTCTLITIRVMNNIYSKSRYPGMVYVPLSFFNAQQQIDGAESIGSDGFTIKLNREFGYQPSPVTRHSRHSHQGSFGGSTRDSRGTTAMTTTTMTTIATPGTAGTMDKDPSILLPTQLTASTSNSITPNSTMRKGPMSTTSTTTKAATGEESIVFSAMEERCLRAVRVSGGSTTVVAEGEGLNVVVRDHEVCRLSPLDSKFDDVDNDISYNSSNTNKHRKGRRRNKKNSGSDGDMVMLPEMEYDKSGWVTDLFSLFRIRDTPGMPGVAR